MKLASFLLYLGNHYRYCDFLQVSLSISIELDRFIMYGTIELLLPGWWCQKATYVQMKLLNCFTYISGTTTDMDIITDYCEKLSMRYSIIMLVIFHWPS